VGLRDWLISNCVVVVQWTVQETDQVADQAEEAETESLAQAEEENKTEMTPETESVKEVT
jgi:hypothetical protein